MTLPDNRLNSAYQEMSCLAMKCRNEAQLPSLLGVVFKLLMGQSETIAEAYNLQKNLA
jgi:hypothetical protein